MTRFACSTGPSRSRSSNLTRQLPLNHLLTGGTVSVIAAYGLFALAAPLTKWLMIQGREIGLSGSDAISFCNLLFLGNLSAAVLAFATSRRRDAIHALMTLSTRGWISLISSVAFSIVTPAAFFFALSQTSVSNVIFISRAGPIFFAIGGTFMLGQKLSRQQFLGYGFIGSAILLALVFGNHAMFSVGDGLALAAAFGAAMVSLLGRAALDELGLQPFVFARNLLSAVGFGAIALTMFGPTHFADLVLPEVVVAVAIYGAVVVGAAQLLWFHAVAHATPRRIGGWSFVSPMVAILATVLLLQQRPHPAQCLALAMVVVGMSIAARGTIRRPGPPADATLAAA